jgi:septal ring factor EnvC (AmiA/AmiB activator)
VDAHEPPLAGDDFAEESAEALPCPVEAVVECVLRDMVWRVSTLDAQAATIRQFISDLRTRELVSDQVHEAAAMMRKEVDDVKEFLQQEKSLLADQYRAEIHGLGERVEELKSELALCESAAAQCMEEKAVADKVAAQLREEKEKKDAVIAALMVSCRNRPRTT